MEVGAGEGVRQVGAFAEEGAEEGAGGGGGASGHEEGGGCEGCCG